MPWLGLACLRKACLLVGAGTGLAGAAFEALLCACAGAVSVLAGAACDCVGAGLFRAAAGSVGGTREAAGPLGGFGV